MFHFFQLLFKVFMIVMILKILFVSDFRISLKSCVSYLLHELFSSEIFLLLFLLFFFFVINNIK